MSVKLNRMWVAFVAMICVCGTSISAFAQNAPAATTSTAEPPPSQPGFMTIVFGGTIVDIVIWLMLFATSAATLAFIIDAIISLKREKLIPPDLVEGVRASLNEGDLNSAIATCEENPSPLSNILMIGFSNITEGFEVIQDSISAAAEYESEKLLQKVNYLNVFGQIAPMLGLLGTVTGMVSAFGGMATKQGAGKAAALALAISSALWTTCVGLLISVPALISYTLCRNNAIRIILESEATVIDLIKTLRNAEVDAEAEEEA